MAVSTPGDREGNRRRDVLSARARARARHDHERRGVTDLEALREAVADNRASLSQRIGWLAPIVGTLCFVLLLELLVRSGVIDSRLLPPPTEIAETLWDEAGSSEFWTAIGNTLRSWAVGLALAVALAVPAGIVIGSNEWAYRSVRFFVDFVRPIPSIAILPLLMLVVGIDPKLKIYMIAISAFWPMFFQTAYGIQDVDPIVRDTARSYQVGPMRRFFFVSIPGSTPFIATGLRLSASIALLLAVGTEMVVGLPGLGFEIFAAQYAGHITRMYALVAASGILGMLIGAAFTRVERRALRWHASQRKEIPT
jgi:ABC-type nitrate/sulfonate/bicarbonate transport system permease component